MYVRTRIPKQDDALLISLALENFPVGKEKIQEKLDSAHEVLLACDKNDKIMGFISYRFKHDKFFVDMVVVDPEYHGRGLATPLYKSFVKYAKAQGVNSIWGIVYKNNEKALDIYDHWGFQVRKEYKNALLIEKII